VLGPRALAVISCALALLAVQPVMAASPGVGGTATVKVASAGGVAIVGETVGIASTNVRKTRGVGQPALLSSARRLHILATVEILHRLLAFELRPTERQMAAALIFAPLELCTVDRPAVALQRVEPVDCLRLSHEREFAITHCLLAPPIA